MKGFTASFIAIDKTDQQSRVANRIVQTVEHFEILWNEARLKDQVLRRITGDGEFGSNDQLCARRT